MSEKKCWLIVVCCILGLAITGFFAVLECTERFHQKRRLGQSSPLPARQTTPGAPAQQPRLVMEDELLVVIDYDKPLEELIAAGRYSQVAKMVNEKNFPKSQEAGSGKQEVTVTTFHFQGGNIDSPEVIREMKKSNYRPATIRELLTVFAKMEQFKELLPTDTCLVALGTPYQVREFKGSMAIWSCRFGGLGQNDWRLVGNFGPWHGPTWFLAVRLRRPK